jgi:tetratricopeptide (TPR) repeat protein
MSPYARSILKFLSITYVIGLAGGVYALYTNLPIPHPVYWVVIGLLLVTSVTYSYYNAVGELRDLAGFYRAVGQLKRDAKNTFEDLGVKTYLDYYRVRSDDAATRGKLKEKRGVLVVGKPLSGKTRAAIEAINATRPNAFLLRFDSESFTDERIDKVVIPCLLVFLRKPEVVLFFDNIDTLDLNLIDKLIRRLADQTSSLYVVSTCDSGRKELRVRPLQQGTRPYLFEPVYLDALSKEISNEIFAEVWKERGFPLLADLSLPGYIVSGSNPVLGKVRSLSEEDKKVIQALRLAACCGVLECEEKLFWGILEDVLDSRPQDRPALLGRFIDEGMILIQNPRGSAKRVLIQHTSYLDEAYDDLRQFRLDLAALADWLFGQRDAQRMAALGSHHWNVLFDSSSARKVYEQLDKLDVPESSYLLALAALHAEQGESKLETEMLNRALALSSKPVEQAQTLVSHGDSLLYRLLRPADAIGYYNRAYELIGQSGDATTLELIIRRTGDTLLVNRQYAEAEPYFRQWLAGAKADDLLDASERLALSLVGQGKNGDADQTLRHLWTDLPRDKRIDRALLLLDNSEGCLADPGPVRAISQLALDCFIAGANAAPELKTRGEEIVLFGYHLLSSGFLQASELTHTYLIKASELNLDRENRSAVWINLGLTLYLLGHAEAARKAQEKALSIASDSPKLGHLVAGAEAGLGDYKLLIDGSKEAKEHYERALHLAEKSDDTNIVNWAHLGLGEVALAEKNYEEAEQHFLMLDVIINSYQQYMRIWLGMARVRIHLKQWEEAESFLTRGLSLRKRRDFTLRREEFQKEFESLPKAKGMKGSVVLLKSLLAPIS